MSFFVRIVGLVFKSSEMPSKGDNDKARMRLVLLVAITSGGVEPPEQ